MTELNDDQRAIAEECDAVKAMLLDKNKNYGNSALDPVRVFSKADAVEQILVRLDDKLSRLTRGAEAGEDITFDIIGYLVLLRIAQRRQKPLAGSAIAKLLVHGYSHHEGWGLCNREGRTTNELEKITCPQCKYIAEQRISDTPDDRIHMAPRASQFGRTRCGAEPGVGGVTTALDRASCVDCLTTFSNEAKHPGPMPVRTVHIASGPKALCDERNPMSVRTNDPEAATCIECKRVYEEEHK